MCTIEKKFIESSIKERLLYHYIIEDNSIANDNYYYTSIDGYDSFDSSAITSTGYYKNDNKVATATRKSVTEIKVRNNNQDMYDSTIIEMYKLQQLYTIQQQVTPSTAYYVVFFSDSYVMINLSSYIDKMLMGRLPIENIRCRKSTMKDNGEKWKPCVKISLSPHNSAIITNTYYSDMHDNKIIKDGVIDNDILSTMVDKRYKKHINEIK